MQALRVPLRHSISSAMELELLAFCLWLLLIPLTAGLDKERLRASLPI
jgi:hypothetical protein